MDHTSPILFVLLHLLSGYNSSKEKDSTTRIVCENSYIYTNLTHKSWLNPTPNRFHASYTPMRYYYQPNDVVRFYCRHGKFFQGTANLRHGESRCLPNTLWSREWPMCKAYTCDRLRIANGYIDDENKPLPPDTMATIRCYSGFYLWGSNQSVCTPRLHWTHHDFHGRRRKCVRLETYKEYCKSALMTFKIRLDTGEPECTGGHIHDPVEVRNHTRRIILGASVPLSTLFIIMLLLSIMYVRRLRAYHRRMAAVVRFQNTDQSIHLVLPSYEDAVKSKPTSPPPSYFEEAAVPMLQSQDVTVTTESTNLNSPPAYVE